MRAPVRLITLLAALAGGIAFTGQMRQVHAQAPVPTFKVQVEYIEVDAVVTDQQGNFVPNLNKGDFQIFEDGKSQVVSSFGLVNIPVDTVAPTPAAVRTFEPDVQSNERPFDGRLYVMVLDDLHVDSMRSQRVKQSARLFIERNMGPNDLMAVIFSGRSADAQEFTGNKRLLLNAVDKFIGRKLQSATLARNERYEVERAIVDSAGAQGSAVAMPRIADPYDEERAQNAQNLLTTLRRVAAWVEGVQGRRKALLFFSEGIDYNLDDIIRPARSGGPPSAALPIMNELRDTIAATARSNVSIYGVDPRGLTDVADDATAVSSFADQSDPGSGIGLASMRNELRISQESLRWLSDDSGGFAAVNRNDTANVFDRIVRDNSSYYVLAYTPPTNKADGKSHRIEVKVNRPGFVVRARRGYASPQSKPATKTTDTLGLPPEMFAALDSPLPQSGLHMRVFAAPFKGAQPNASAVVGVELAGQDLPMGANSKVEISMVAVDSQSKVFGPLNNALTLNLSPDSQARVAQSGVRVLSRMDLPAGRYQLRVAARDRQKNALGSVILDLDVPDFTKEPIALSGLLMTSPVGAAVMTARADEQLRAVLPGPPMGLRVFEQGEELALFTEIYSNSSGANESVDLLTTVRTDASATVFENRESYGPAELVESKRAYVATTRVPLSELTPGEYVLTLEARSRQGKSAVATREVRLRIVPRVTERRP